MSSPLNQDHQQNRVAPPRDSLLPDPPRDRDLPPNPPIQFTQSVSETASQSQFMAESTDPTNPTTVYSVPQDKSAPNSLDDPHQPGARPRVASLNFHEYDRNATSRYPTLTRPRPVLQHDGNAYPSPRPQSGFERIAPTAAGEKRREKTVGERLKPTMEVAQIEMDKYAAIAKRYGMALNIAIGLQVAVGALTTGVAAATTGRATSIGVSILGGLSTMLASFLARARGSGEPDFSNLRARELGTFVREADAWILDHGHLVGSEYDERINMFRERFEKIIKTEGEDSASGTNFGAQQAKPASPGTTLPPPQGQQWHGNPKAGEKV